VRLSRAQKEWLECRRTITMYAMKLLFRNLRPFVYLLSESFRLSVVHDWCGALYDVHHFEERPVSLLEPFLFFADEPNSKGIS